MRKGKAVLDADDATWEGNGAQDRDEPEPDGSCNDGDERTFNPATRFDRGPCNEREPKP